MTTNPHLLALSLIRASMDGDEDALRVIMTNNEPTPELIAALVTLCGGFLQTALGEERASEVIEAWSLRVVDGQTW